MNLLTIVFAFSICVSIVNSSVSRSNFVHRGLVYASKTQHEISTPASRRSRTESISTSNNNSRNPPYQTRSGGFNLLWLISSRIHQETVTKSYSQRRKGYTPGYRTGMTYPRRLYRQGLPLHSSLPNRILRYHRLRRNGTVEVKRMISGKHIGFEMHVRVENTSGDGYVITGRSLGSGGESGADVAEEASRDRSQREDASSSWFGLFCSIVGSQLDLRLEYRNFAWKSKKKLIVSLDYTPLRIDQWHKLAVQMDFERNTIEYWINCSKADTIHVGNKKSFPKTHFNIYRLLHHRNRAKMPVQVTFKSVIVTDGNTKGLPKQCFSSSNVSEQECSGGRIFMECGPSCEQTCDSRLSSLHGCTSTCLRGCHCPPGEVYHGGKCILPSSCPCRIGAKRHLPGANVTINNEICTCVTGKWQCYAAASFTTRPQNATVMIGRDITLICGVTGNPLPIINWKIPDGVNARIESQVGRRKSRLYLTNVTQAHIGLYVCQASREIDGWTANTSALISVTSPPAITSLPSTVTVTLGSPAASIDCGITGIPTPRAAWVKRGIKPDFFTVSPGVLRLKITNVNISDAGEYNCVAKNSVGLAKRSVMILVKLPAPNSMAFKKQPQDRCVKRNHNAVFPCQIIDHTPETNVTWFKNGHPIRYERNRIVKKKYKLVIRRVTKEDTGDYSCLVSGLHIENNMQASAKLMLKGRMLSWSPWTSCSQSCGQGYKFKRRNCTGFPQNRKTCHGKFLKRKRCNSQRCPGVCSSYGDPHYTTYDGRRFNFQGDCSYTLTKDVGGNDFKIIQYNVGCGARLSCVQKLTVILAYPSLSAVVDLGRDQTVLLNGVPLALPFFSSNANLSIAQVGLYLTLRIGMDLEIRWATPHRLYVAISGRYRSRTQGLCGNFDGNADDDNLSPLGRPISTDIEFGQSWAVKDGNTNFSCSAVSTLHHPCKRDPETAARARGACVLLLDKSRFSDCHPVVDPGPFITSCMIDICSTSIQKTNMYFCIALSAYAEECLRNNVVLKWRTEDVCPVTCTGGMVYSECGPNCLRYCPSKIKDESICLSNGRCVAGCYCPDDKVLHNGACIPLSECPCVFNGMVFSTGSRHDRNCQRCLCLGGGWRCVFNSMLCDYPASVVRGPHSQVVPYAYSVVFCCGVTGIPLPTIQWYHNGRKLNESRSGQNTKDRNHDDLNSTLFLDNISEEDAGSYTCKATNEHGSHHSNPATLSIVDPSMSSCNPNPAFNYVHLPEGCYVRHNGNSENVVNLGRCNSNSCYQSSTNPNHRLSCNPTRHCCQPSATTPVLVRCRHTSYSTSFLVTVVQQCACAICSERSTVVEGVVKAAGTGRPLKHFKLSHQGRTVGYTSSAGSFRIHFPNLSVETRHVTISVTDVIFKRFSKTIKNLLVLPGESTLHTITMHPCKLKLQFNATNGLQYIFKPTDGYSHRMRLTIPPNSLITNRRFAPYRGIVKVGISLIDKEKVDRGHGQSLPGSSIAISLSGEEQLLSPSVILCISLYSRDDLPVDLLPGEYATLSLTSHGLGMKMKSWTLDDLTGYWRENGNPLEVVPHYTKRGDKALIATARIKRLNTAWALGISQHPCYLRARVLDQYNGTVPAIKISFSGADASGSSTMMNAKDATNPNHKKPMQFTSYVEDLTSSDTYVNGVCLPVGCHDRGMLHASRIGNNLVLLDPETPPSAMGQVKNMRLMTGNKTRFEINSKVLDTSVVYNTTNISSHYAYFHSREECRDTSPTLQTYVFRDNTEVHDGSILSRFKNKSNYHNHVILTFGMPSQGQGSTRPLFKYCHIKVAIRLHPTFQYPTPLQLEVVTFRNKTSESRSSMTMLGWRHEDIHPLPYGATRAAIQYLCVEYLCGGIRLTDKEQIVLHVNIRQKKEKNVVQTSERPHCKFSLFPSPSKRTNVELDNSIGESYNDLSEETFNRGGHVYIRKSFNVRTRPYRATNNREISNEFSARTLAESKQKCVKSNTEENISSYFECL